MELENIKGHNPRDLLLAARNSQNEIIGKEGKKHRNCGNLTVANQNQ